MPRSASTPSSAARHHHPRRSSSRAAAYRDHTAWFRYAAARLLNHRPEGRLPCPRPRRSTNGRRSPHSPSRAAPSSCRCRMPGAPTPPAPRSRPTAASPGCVTARSSPTGCRRPARSTRRRPSSTGAIAPSPPARTGSNRIVAAAASGAPLRRQRDAARALRAGRQRRRIGSRRRPGVVGLPARRLRPLDVGGARARTPARLDAARWSARHRADDRLPGVVVAASLLRLVGDAHRRDPHLDARQHRRRAARCSREPFLDLARSAAAAGTADAIIEFIRREGIRDGHLIKWVGSDQVDASLAALVGLLRRDRADEPARAARPSPSWIASSRSTGACTGSSPTPSTAAASGRCSAACSVSHTRPHPTIRPRARTAALGRRDRPRRPDRCPSRSPTTCSIRRSSPNGRSAGAHRPIRCSGRRRCSSGSRSSSASSSRRRETGPERHA